MFTDFFKKCRFYGQDYFGTRSYSQFGEDLLVKAFLGDKWRWDYSGFYVDIGAHDPRTLSNTKKFYDVGWRGINVDASADAIMKFMRHRKRDINVNVGIGLNKGELDYYRLSESAMNTFSKEFANKMIENGVSILGIEKIPVIPLSELLDTYLPTGQHIDFLDIDCEGLDVEILQSNNWKRYRPDLILAEIHTDSKNWEIAKTPAVKFLRSIGYELVGQSRITSVFQDIVSPAS